MKVLCHREGLLSAFQLASAVVPARDVKPVLRNLKAIAEELRWTFRQKEVILKSYDTAEAEHITEEPRR